MPPSTWPLNPFAADVCSTPYEVAEGRSVPTMNRDILQRVANAIEDLGEGQSQGRQGKPLLLLTAPRAGYGKTHLLGRMAAVAESQAVAMPLVFRSDSEVSWSGVSREAVEILRQLPGKQTGWPRLRELCAGIFASMVMRLIRDGRLPCANAEQAMRVLSQEPCDLFREGTSAKLIGDWLKKHFAQLRKPLSDLARSLPNAGPMEAWVDALFAGAHHGSMTALETVVSLASGSRAAFELWLRLVTLWRPAVLFVDHLDGFYRQEDAGLRIATMLLELAEMESVHVVLSLNQDVWQATFAHHLPSALEDRLTASQFLLRGLSATDAGDLLRLRLREGRVGTDESQQFEAFLDVPRYFQGRPVGSVSARVFLRHCAMQWEAFQQIKVRGHEPFISPAEDDELPASLLPDEGPGTSLLDGDELPQSTIFGNDDAARLQTLANGLHEPKPAMVNTPFSLATAPPPLPPQNEPPKVPPASNGLIQPMAGFLAAGAGLGTTPFALATPTSSPPAAEPLPHPDWTGQPAEQSQPRAPGALEKLREMMDRLRSQPGQTPPSTPAVAGAATRLSDVLSDSTQPTNAELISRFEAHRNEMVREAQSLPLDLGMLGDLIRLAGKRFPLVRFEEIELPGISGKLVPCWNLQGMEIFFGLSHFNDLEYWRSLSAFLVRRVEELRSAPGAQSSQVKLVAMKSDRETLSWTSLQGTEAVPLAVRQRMEVLHLDTRSIAALYAMQRMIADSENGSLNATPSQVMSVLARELDFFWKRVTRPLTPVA
ncbi:MAG: hypothetical protein JWO89_3025 [Verrucomicrobiaceae bacterium]|nr:hypothetical protein [Verrucomicrobiaceae bacterium]